MATDATTLPASPDSDGHYEVIGSEIVETPPMGVFESELASILQRILGTWAHDHRQGRVVTETLFDLRPAVDRQRRPDLAFVSAERWPLDHRAPRAASWAVVPDLAIEVVSPTNTAEEVLAKLEDYFAAGVRRAWVIYAEPPKVYDYDAPKSVRILDRDDELDGGALLPGFRLSVRDLIGDGPGPA